MDRSHPSTVRWDKMLNQAQLQIIGVQYWHCGLLCLIEMNDKSFRKFIRERRRTVHKLITFMANDESPIVEDAFLGSTSFIGENNDDSGTFGNEMDVGLSSNLELPISPFLIDSLWLNGVKNEMNVEEFFIDSSIPFTSLWSENSLDMLSSSSTDLETSPMNDQEFKCQNDLVHGQSRSLVFINPPESVYHVRYLSEITSSPLDGNMVNTRKKTKKNISGRYLKGMHGRHVTISFPFDLPDQLDLYVRVTRLTVPYQGIVFIHPYPLLYSPPKRKMYSDVIIDDSSIYYKLSSAERCDRVKQFPNIILTRRKQCHLKNMQFLEPFEQSEFNQPFMGNSAKNKIAVYQLKQSLLDFRLVTRCPKTGNFLNLNAFCRTGPLLEEEGTECKKGSRPTTRSF